MLTKNDLKQIEEIVAKSIIANNERLVAAFDIKFDRMDIKMQQLEEKLSKKIEDSQTDTIETLSELIDTGYNLHEKRIKRIEKELNLAPLKQN